MKNRTKLSIATGTGRLLRAGLLLALCAALMLCMGQAALAQTYTMEGVTLTLPDGFEQEDGNFNFCRYSMGEYPEEHALSLGIGHFGGGEEDLGLTMDWIWEQLENGGEYVQNLVNGQPTLYVQAVNEQAQVSYALAATMIDGIRLGGFERQTSTTEPVGDMLLDVLRSAQRYYPQLVKGVASATEEPEPSPEPDEPEEEAARPTNAPVASGSLLDVYDPEECMAWSLNETHLHYLGYPEEREAEDDFLFCQLDWDTDLDTALRTIAANTERRMELTANGSYMGMASGKNFWGLNSNECYLTLCTVVPEDGGWWLECQITPENVTFEDEEQAASWFARVWSSLNWEKHDAPRFTLETAQGAQAFEDETGLIERWISAVQAGEEGVYASIAINNLTLSLEKDVYGDMSIISSWIKLVPGDAR